MRLAWLEDLVAVLRTGSLTRAAQFRHVTQPAFSRRIKSIEAYLGVALFDRSHKPAQLSTVVLAQQDKLEQLVKDFHDVLYEFRHQDRVLKNQIVIASQHAITTAITPTLVKQLATDIVMHVRLLAANRDECLALLLTGQADLALVYRTAQGTWPLDAGFIEQIEFGEDRLVPVFNTQAATTLTAQCESGELPIITYPSDVFLGEVMQRYVLPDLRARFFLIEKTQSALTSAVLQLALDGVGVGWVPQSLAAKEIGYGNLTNLGDLFGDAALNMGAVRLTGKKSAAEQNVWNVIRDIAAQRLADR